MALINESMNFFIFFRYFLAKTRINSPGFGDIFAESKGNPLLQKALLRNADY